MQLQKRQIAMWDLYSAQSSKDAHIFMRYHLTDRLCVRTGRRRSQKWRMVPRIRASVISPSIGRQHLKIYIAYQRNVTSKKSHVTRHKQGFLPTPIPPIMINDPRSPSSSGHHGLEHLPRKHPGQIKDEKHHPLYFIRSPPKIFSTPAKHVYRGGSESSPHMAKICKNGHLFPQFCIKLEDQQVVLDTNKRDSKSTTFEVDGKEFVGD